MNQPALQNLVTTPSIIEGAKPVSVNQMELLLECSPKRKQVEDYIAEKFHQIHNAEITQFLPILISIAQNEQHSGAFGLRPGQYRPMFLEQYLDSPIEQQVAIIAKKPVDRCSLIEIGNLAVTRPGHGALLMVTLATALEQAGFEWMVFTATKQMEKLMKRLGFVPHTMVPADPNRLGSNKANWGTYYENNPRVMVGSLAQAKAVIQNNPKLAQIAQQNKQQINTIACLLSDYRRLTSD